MNDYILSESGVIRTRDNASIPNDDRNRDWRLYQEWLADGNTPDPIPEMMVDPNIAETETIKLAAKNKLVSLGLTEPEAATVAGVEETTPA